MGVWRPTAHHPTTANSNLRPQRQLTVLPAADVQRPVETLPHGSTATIDPLEEQFRLDSVWTGAWMTLVVCVPALVYGLTDARPAHRTVFISAWAFALIGAGAAFALPWRRIIRSRWREAAFLSWTALDMLIIALAVIADGGPRSPVVTLFLVPMVFVGVSYPRWSVMLVIAVTLLGYTVGAIAYSVPAGRSILGLAALFGVGLMCVWQARNHERRRAELARISNTDPLTGCLNRRGATAAHSPCWGRRIRFGQPFAVMLIDLDNFKDYNDLHGHAAGDRLLCWLVEQIGRELRPSDSLVRLGGDEFAVLAAGVDTAGAAPLMARVRAAIADGAPHSAGIASAPGDGADIDALYRVADQQLYAEKRARAGSSARAAAGGSS